MRKIVIVVLGAFLTALSMNFFLIPANVYASGFTGVAQLLYKISADFLPFTISTGVSLFILNIPVTIIGWKKVGKTFTLYSFLSVLLMSFFLEVIPIYAQSEDIILNAVFGGVLGGVGVGLTLKWGASTGGLDIIAMVLSRMNDRPVGTYFFLMNAVIILTAGFLYGSEKALYTLVTLYVTTRVIDAIHTRHQKLTVMIITKRSTELTKEIQTRLMRGITSVRVKGGYSNENQDMLIVVITRYELYDMKRLIKEIDPQAFTNVVQTTDVFGFFRKD